MAMKLWIISQTENNDYDTYDSAVVAAETENAARQINPDAMTEGNWGRPYRSWCSAPELVTVELLGDAVPGTAAGIILASYNAG